MLSTSKLDKSFPKSTMAACMSGKDAFGVVDLAGAGFCEVGLHEISHEAARSEPATLLWA